MNTAKKEAQRVAQELTDITFESGNTVSKPMIRALAGMLVEKMIVENQSLLSMLKIHSDARARLAIHCRLGELENIKKEINDL